MKRPRAIKPKLRRVDLPDFRNVERGRAALRTMIEAGDSGEKLKRVAEEMERKREKKIEG